jgi:hypothetical protein
MGLLNTGLNALGTYAAVKSLIGTPPSQTAANSRYGKFLAEMRQNSVAKTNYFEVRITAPSVLLGPKGTVASKIELYAEGTPFPGLFLQTGEMKRYGVGPIEKYPYSLQTNSLQMNFIGDGKGEIYKFFYNWMQNIVRGDFPIEQQTQGTQAISASGLAPYEVEFKNNYSVPIDIFLYNEEHSTVLHYNLTQAFPVRIPDINLSWRDTDSLMQFAVDFEFLQSNLVNSEEKFEVNKNGPNQLSLLQKLVKVGTAVQALSSLRKPQSLQDGLISAGNIKNVIKNF